jgi:hypothetical protein
MCFCYMLASQFYQDPKIGELQDIRQAHTCTRPYRRTEANKEAQPSLSAARPAPGDPLALPAMSPTDRACRHC